MPSLKTLFLASLACAGITNAATCKGDYTIESDGDVSQLDSCDDVTGSITLGEGCTSILFPERLKLIGGDLIANGARVLSSLSAPGLQEIKGDFRLQELTLLGTLSCPELTKVGTINWITLPNLKALLFTQEVTQCSEVLITDTNLSSLDGINLTTCRIFNINNNKYLKTVNVALGNVSDALSIEFNAKNVDVSFPDLVWAMNITVRDAGSVSFPKLEHVNSTIAFINNTFTDAYFPGLTEVGESFTFNSNTRLTNVTADKLETIGGTFQLANNTQLKEIDGFPMLSTVEGSIDYSGSFTNATLPSLDDVRGGFNAQTTEDFDCTEFDNYHNDGVIKGDGYTCAGKLDEAKSATGGASTAGSGNGDEPGAATRAGVSVMALIAAGAAMLVL